MVSDDISLHVEDGVATLTSTMSSWRELKAAVENAFEGGAHAVINHLKVKETPTYKYPEHYDPYHIYQDGP